MSFMVDADSIDHRVLLPLIDSKVAARTRFILGLFQVILFYILRDISEMNMIAVLSMSKSKVRIK